MRLARGLCGVLVTLGLAGCAIHNYEDRDEALRDAAGELRPEITLIQSLNADPRELHGDRAGQKRWLEAARPLLDNSRITLVQAESEWESMTVTSDGTLETCTSVDWDKLYEKPPRITAGVWSGGYRIPTPGNQRMTLSRCVAMADGETRFAYLVRVERPGSDFAMRYVMVGGEADEAYADGPLLLRRLTGKSAGAGDS